MSQAIRAEFEPLRSLGFASISGTYAAIGTAFLHPMRNIWIFNGTDRFLHFSKDGFTDHVVLPANAYWFYDVTSNKSRDQGFYVAEGTKFYVKTPTTAPSLGKVYVTTMYGSEL